MNRAFAISIAVYFAAAIPTAAAEPTAREREFFEKRIRPVLVEQCYSCHSTAAKKVRGGLLLDSADGLRRGGERGAALVPGRPKESLLIQALRHEQDLRMPPKGTLPEAVIADFVHWVEAGAPDPRTEATLITPRRAAFRITEADRGHWAFVPVADVSPPIVRDAGWCRSPVDRFILARLEEQGLRPTEPADRLALLRRVSFDLAGLPPTPAEIDAFMKDGSARAFEKVVDRLLATRAFGERWARHWLDGVRYASDVDRGGLYRDWVVRALNEDLPYDQFVRLQIAGDLLLANTSDPARVHVSGASLDGITATGMLSLAVWERVGRDLAVAEIVDSQIDLVGRQLLGLTIACARCHDHKFDPISAEDYYALAGIFFSSHISPGKLFSDARLTDEVIRVPLLSQADAVRNRPAEEEISRLQKAIAGLEARAGPAVRLHALRAQLREMPRRIAAATGATARKTLDGEAAKLRAEEKTLLDDRARRNWPESPAELVEIERLRKQAAALQRSLIAAPATISIRDGGVPGSKRQRIGDAPILLRGDYQKEGPIVPRRFPVILAGEKQMPLGRRTTGSGRRELAEWIARSDHPLTARVQVNRIWLHLFGEGLVRTPDNFGRLGERPIHGELLDFMARRFVASGWSIKRLVRELVLSSAYRQGSFADAGLVRADPENRLFGRANRKRLDHESLRDALLFASGQLRGAAGMPGSRRTLYEPIERGRTDPARALFDGADPLGVVPKRAATTTAPQALYLLNNTFVAQAAQALGKGIQADSSLPDKSARITHAYLRLLGRLPTSEEIRIGKSYVTGRTWPDFVQVLVCTNEFVYLD